MYESTIAQKDPKAADKWRADIILGVLIIGFSVYLYLVGAENIFFTKANPGFWDKVYAPAFVIGVGSLVLGFVRKRRIRNK